MEVTIKVAVQATWSHGGDHDMPPSSGVVSVTQDVVLGVCSAPREDERVRAVIRALEGIALAGEAAVRLAL
jgi:hypothetical protein